MQRASRRLRKCSIGRLPVTCSPGCLVLVLVLSGTVRTAAAATYQGDPGNYKSLVGQLNPGDTLELAAGDYTEGLPLSDVHGEPGNPITITGPAEGAPAVFLGSNSRNTVQLESSSYLVIRNLKLDGQNLAGPHGVDARGECHDITLEHLTVVDHGNNQQVCGIAANKTTYYWNWVIRDCNITGAGTGMYLGEWQGDGGFCTALVENNVILDTVGYCIQFKVQNSRPSHVPEGVTIIRDNVFSKVENASGGTDDGARPNLLVDPFPDSGRGSNDMYLIYGNFFYQNYESDALFQGTGNIGFYNNVLVNEKGSKHAIHILGHNGNNKKIRVFFNTVLADGNGIEVTSTEGSDQYVFGNAVFAGTPFNLAGSVASFDNISDSYGNADQYVNAPFAPLGELDLYPKPGTLRGSAIDTSSVEDLQDWNLDFNGDPRDGTFRGAYAGEGENPGWTLAREKKELEGEPVAPQGPVCSISADRTELLEGGTVTFTADASDPDGGAIQSYEWDFDGDGTYDRDTGSTSSVDHQFDTPGTFTVSVRVTDDENETAVDTVEITVWADADSDGLPDWWEEEHFGSIDACDPKADVDEDGLNNAQEFAEGTDPRNPDTDGDEIPDGDDPDPLETPPPFHGGCGWTVLPSTGSVRQAHGPSPSRAGPEPAEGSLPQGGTAAGVLAALFVVLLIRRRRRD